MSLTRRRLLLASALAVCAAVYQRTAHAAQGLLAWPKRAFESTQVEAALRLLYGRHRREPSERIQLDLPNVAEDGAVVPLTLRTDLPQVERIALLADKNPNVLIAEFIFEGPTLPYLATHIKLNADGEVIAVVKSQGRYYEARKFVKVSLSGCL